MTRLLDALLDELAADPAAVDRLRRLVGAPPEPRGVPGAPAYTVASLARELGRTERAIRGAIARGELEAVKRGRGYVISADAVAAWATGSRGHRAVPTGRRSRPRPGTGPMRRALG